MPLAFKILTTKSSFLPTWKKEALNYKNKYKPIEKKWTINVNAKRQKV